VAALFRVRKGGVKKDVGSRSLFAIGGSHECDPYIIIAAGIYLAAKQRFDRFNSCRKGVKRLYLPYPLSPSLHEMQKGT
jgi:hypothetical protein